MKKSWFSSNISLYFVNDTKQNHSYYGRWIGNRNQAFEWCQFEWPRVSLTTYSITRSIERSLRDSRASCESIVNTGVWRTDGQTDMPVIAEFLCKNQSSPRINIIKPWPYALFIAFTINCKKRSWQTRYDLKVIIINQCCAVVLLRTRGRCRCHGANRLPCYLVIELSSASTASQASAKN